MNDGMGRMSRSLARKIAECLGLDRTPAGYQGRIGCAKGVWIIDVDDDGLEDDDWIETYQSQEKWNCDFQDVHHRTFEVKDWPRDIRSAYLNQQFIPVLEERALDRMAMRKTIAEHLVNNLMSDLDAQKASLGHPADLRLWLRQSGQARGSSVFDGHVQFLAGLPNSNEDAIAFMLDAGFDQQKLKYIQTSCQDFANDRAQDLKRKSHIKIPQSANMIMVADLQSVLEEGEVHVSFSSRFQVEGFCDTLLEGMYILVARSPAHLPSDIQKVRVVSHPELRHLKDVIIFSTKGRCSLAGKLSGGDFDGDVAWVCWDRKIVDNFENAAVPQCLDLFDAGYLRKLEQTVQDLRTPGMSTDDWCVEFVHASFVSNMAQSLLGQCTKFKEKLCYNQNTVGSGEAIILSNLLGHLVDQRKQGTLFTNDDLKRLKRDLKIPYLVNPDYDKERRSDRSEKKGETHILDCLKFDVAGPVIERAMADFQQAIEGSGGQWFDADLTRMYNDYDNKAQTSQMWKELLSQLRKDIEAVSTAWKASVNERRKGASDYATKVKEIYQKWLDIMPSEQVRSLEPVQVLMERWNPTWRQSSLWALLKASATFKFNYGHGETFLWRMAGHQLCLLKSKATTVEGNTYPAIIHPEMYASLRPDKRFIMARRAERGMARGEESAAALEEVREFDDYGMVLDDP